MNRKWSASAIIDMHYRKKGLHYRKQLNPSKERSSFMKNQDCFSAREVSFGLVGSSQIKTL